MDTKSITDLIGTLGFPIVVTLWLLYRDYKWVTNLLIIEQQELDLLKQLVSNSINVKYDTEALRKGVEGLYPKT